MAKTAGINTPLFRLISDGEAAHFAIKRFDRAGSNRIHMHTMAGLLHHDFNQLGSDYLDLFKLSGAITRDKSHDIELFRRMTFNFHFGVRDEHAKNHSFLYEKKQWALSPAYDVTYSRGRSTNSNPRHEMSVLGKASGVTHDDLRVFGQRVGLPKGLVDESINRVIETGRQWMTFADQSGLTEERAADIFNRFEPIDTPPPLAGKESHAAHRRSTSREVGGR